MGKVFGNALFAGVANYLEFFLGLAASILIARSLGPESFGLYSYFTWLIGLFATFVNTALGLATIRYIAAARSTVGEADSVLQIFGYIRTMQAKFALVGLVLIGLLCILTIEPTDTSLSLVLPLLALSGVLRVYHMLRISAFKGLESFQPIAIAALINGILQLIILAACYWISATLEGFVIAYFLTSLLFNCVSLVMLKRTLPNKQVEPLPVSQRKPIFKYVTELTPATILTYFAYGHSELFFLKYFVDNQSVAFFSLAFLLANSAIALVPGIVEMVLLPVVTRSMSGTKNASSVLLGHVFRYLALLNLLVLGPVLLFAGEIIEMLYGAAFLAAAMPLQVLLLIKCVGTYDSACQAYLLAAERSSLILKLAAVGFVLSLLLDIVLIKFYGLTGAVVAYSVTVLVMVVLKIAVTYRIVGLEADTKRLLLLCSYATVAMWLCSFIELPGLWLTVIVGSSAYGILFLALVFVLKGFNTLDYENIRTLLQSRTFPGSSLLVRHIDRLLAAT